MTRDNEQIYKTLLMEIITMQLKPGDMLKEVDVSKRFNVSRTPIRDVFKRLEYDNLLCIHSQRGSYVSKINLDGITDIMYIRNQVERSVLLELEAVVTPGDIVKFRMIVNDQNALLNSFNDQTDIQVFANKFFELDNVFHENIYTRAGKKSVLDALNSLSPAFARYRFMTFLRDKSEVSSLANIHGEIVDCLEKKDADKLSDIVRQHNFSGLNGIEAVREKHPDFFE